MSKREASQANVLPRDGVTEQSCNVLGVGTQTATCGVCSVPLTGLSPYWSWNQTAGKPIVECVGAWCAVHKSIL